MPERWRRNQEPEPPESLNPYIPVPLGPSIPHYYGDYVRQIFFACGAITLIISPFISSPVLLPFEIGGAIIFVVLGALTNARSQLSLIANSIVAIVGVIGYELLALSLFSSREYIAFIEREAIAIALLIALYFSVKTLRNMLEGKVGKRDVVGEFIPPPGDPEMSAPGDGD